MNYQKPANRGGAIIEFTILIPVWLPLIIGTLWLGAAMIRGQQVTEMARDLASIYSRDSTNLNFNLSYVGSNNQTPVATASNAVLDQITEQLGTLTSSGTGTVIFSTITYAGNSFCAEAGTTYGSISPLSHTGSCTNYGHFVYTQQYVLGNATQLVSSFGTPTGPFDASYNILGSDSVTAAGNVSSFNLITPVPAETGSDGYQSGQPIYVVEVYFQSQGLAGYSRGGNYAYAVF